MDTRKSNGHGTPSHPEYESSSRDETPQLLAPHSVEAEEALLGAILINADGMADTEFLKPEDFFILRNKYVWEAMVRLWRRGDAIDNLTVIEELRALGLLDDVGGGAYTTYLINNTPTSLHAAVYGHIIERAAVRRRLLEAAAEIAQLANAEDMDVNETIDRAETTLARVTQQRIQIDCAEDNYAAVEATFDDMRLRRQQFQEGTPVGIPTGYVMLDKNGMLQPGELLVIAGRSGHGKSAWVSNLIRQAASLGVRFGIFSLEMNREAILRRIVAQIAGINTHRLKMGTTTDAEWQRVEQIQQMMSGWRLNWNTEQGIRFEKLKLKARTWKRMDDINVVVVDYIGIVAPPDYVMRGNRENQVGAIARELKIMAAELNVVVVAVAQLNREMYREDEKRPQLWHIRDSDAILHACDVCGLWNVPELVGGETDVIIQNQRKEDKVAYMHFDKVRDGPKIEIPYLYRMDTQMMTEAVTRKTSVAELDLG